VRFDYSGWRAEVVLGAVQGRFEPSGSLSSSLDAAAVGVARAESVEVIANHGGIMPRAALAGQFSPADGGALQVSVGLRGSLPQGQPKEFSSGLGGDMVVGLDQEFAHDALDGLVRAALLWTRPSCLLLVHGGAYDEVDSGRLAFFRAAELLVAALWSTSEEQEVKIDSIMKSWENRWTIDD
jgi:hypothetical protein